MSWSDPRTYVAGETITAAILNSAVRDNLAQTVMGTTATAIAVGSMGYVSSTGALGRLLIGTTGQALVSTGGVPGWAYLGTVDSVAAGVYALGQKQGGGTNALRIECKITGTTGDGGWKTVTWTWDNVFSTIVGGVANVYTNVSSGTLSSHWIRSLTATGGTYVHALGETTGAIYAIGVGY